MTPAPPYRDRREAGRILGAHLCDELGAGDSVVLALPRGGVPVGFEVARMLDVSLDVFVVRKLGLPSQPEFAMGAIAAGGYQVLNKGVVARYGITAREITAVSEREAAELRRRETLYRAKRAPIDVRDRTAILVDDGLATGFTMRAAIGAVRALGARQLIVAAPVGAPDTCEQLAREVDRLICPFQPDPFDAVGLWYDDFAPTTDEEVRECLAAAAHA